MGVQPRPPPSYIDFFEQVLAETTDLIEIEAKYEEAFATDPWYIHLYRTSYAYHGVHPLYMWYWCAHALQHLGRVIVVGGDRAAVRQMGFSPASTLNDALELAEDTVGGPDDHSSPRAPIALGRGHMTRRVRSALEPYRERLRFVAEEPTGPGGVVTPVPKRTLGGHYDTAWARRYPVRLPGRWSLTIFPGPCCAWRFRPA